jgi:hypothetical protein
MADAIEPQSGGELTFHAADAEGFAKGANVGGTG